MKKTLIALAVSSLAFNVSADEITTDSKQWSTTNTVVAGVAGAGAVALAVIGSSSSSDDGDNARTLPEEPVLPGDIDNLPSDEIDHPSIVEPSTPHIPDTDAVISISGSMILVDGVVVGTYSGNGQIDFANGGTAVIIDTSEGYTMVMPNGDLIYLVAAGDGTYRVSGIDADRDMDGNSPKFIGDVVVEDGTALIRLDDGTIVAITESGEFKIIGTDGNVKDGNINDAGLTVDKRGDGDFLVTNSRGDTYSIVVVDGRISIVADIKGTPETHGFKSKLQQLDKTKIESAKAKVRAKLSR